MAGGLLVVALPFWLLSVRWLSPPLLSFASGDSMAFRKTPQK